MAPRLCCVYLWVFTFMVGGISADPVTPSPLRFHRHHASFEDAMVACSPGVLASLTTQQEVSNVLQLVSQSPPPAESEVMLWMGLRRLKKECVHPSKPLRGFKWIHDGSEDAEVIQWGQEPILTCTAVRCAALKVDLNGTTVVGWGLIPDSCRSNYQFICQHRSVEDDQTAATPGQAQPTTDTPPSTPGPPTPHPQHPSPPGTTRTPDALPKPDPLTPDALPKPDPLTPDALPKPDPLTPDAQIKPDPLTLDALPKPDPLTPDALPKPDPLTPDALPKPDPGLAPSVNNGSNAGSDPGSVPGSDPGSVPGSDPGPGSGPVSASGFCERPKRPKDPAVNHKIRSFILDPEDTRRIKVECWSLEQVEVHCSGDPLVWRLLDDSPANFSAVCRPCEPGFRKDDLGRCVDIDECREGNPCMYSCLNSEGSYRCVCWTGEDGTQYDEDSPACLDTTTTDSKDGFLSGILMPVLIAAAAFVVLVVIVAVTVKCCLMRRSKKRAMKKAEKMAMQNKEEKDAFLTANEKAAT